MLPGGAEQGRPLRRLVLLRRHLDRDLLSAQLPGPHAEAPEHALLPDGRRRPAGWLPRLPALPARRHSGLTRVERPGRRRGPGHAAHPRRRRRPRGDRGAGPASRLQHPPAEPCHQRGGRHGTARSRSGAAQPDGAASCSRRPTCPSPTSPSPPASPACASATTRCGRCLRTRPAACGHEQHEQHGLLDRPRGPRRARGRPRASACASPAGARSARCRYSSSSVRALCPGWNRSRARPTRAALRLPHGHAVITLTAPTPGDPPDPTTGPPYVEGELVLSDLRDLTTAVSRCRQLLDLDADPVAVWEVLRR